MWALKTILFHVLSSFRWLILGFSRLFMFLSLLGFGLSWLLAPDTDAVRLRWLLFAMGVVLWAFSRLYDKFIFKLAVEDREAAL